MGKYKNINKEIDVFKLTPDLNLSQHFIVDSKYLNLITSGLSKNTVIIEVGPGLGQLTEVLAKKFKKVIAIEIDRSFQGQLNKLKSKHRNIEIIFASATSGILNSIIEKERRGNNDLYIVSNFPFNIIEPFINKVIYIGNVKLRLMVGEKFGWQSQITNPDDPNFSELSYICRTFFKINKISDVPRNEFRPIPKTDSVILELTPKKRTTTDNPNDLISQKIILSQKHGALLKNILVNTFIELKKRNKINMTKNESRAMVDKLQIPEDILNKSFSQLNNIELRVLVAKLDKATFI